MGHIRALSTGARITGGVFCLLFALHTWGFVVYDLAELGPGGAWDLWTRVPDGLTDLESMPATSAIDLGLGVLQLAAVFAAFTASWSAGGLLAVTCALTFAYRFQVIWHAAEHDEFTPWYGAQVVHDDTALAVAGGSSALTALLALALAIVLLAGMRGWPRPPRIPGPYGAAPQPQEPPLPSESPQRPTTAGAVTAALYLAVMAAFAVGWNIHAAVQGGGHVWERLLTGERTIFALLDVAPAWRWLVLTGVCGTGALLAATRRISARGFSLGAALVLIPAGVAELARYIRGDMLFELGEEATTVALFARLDTVVTLVGGIVVVVLAMRPGVAVTPPAFPPPFGQQPPGPGYAAPPGQFPGQPPTAPPGGSGYPGPPPAQPPYPAPGGGFGPPGSS